MSSFFKLLLDIKHIKETNKYQNTHWAAGIGLSYLGMLDKTILGFVTTLNEGGV